MTQDESQDFGAILEAFERQQAGGGREPRIGEKARGEIIEIGADAAFVALGGKAEGMVRLEELLDEEGEMTSGVGDTVEGVVAARDPESGCLVLRVRPGRGAGGEAEREELRQAHEHRIPVEGTVREVVKGGVAVEVLGLRAFCPISQLDARYVEDPSEYVGRRLTFRVTRCEGGRGGRPNVVLSRRELLEEEARARAAEARARLEVGKMVRGTVTSVAPYGAFVDLGGIEGLLHVSEMSHSRVEDPGELYAPEQEVEVEVIKIEPPRKAGESERISLSRRSLERDPWEGVAARYPEGETFPGRVARVERFGAFVELEPGVEGLVHVSEMDPGRPVADARRETEVGRAVRVRVLGVDAARRRISLSLAGVVEPGEEESGTMPRRHTAGPGEGATGGLASLGDFLKGETIGGGKKEGS